jgi:hypothetical protein
MNGLWLQKSFVANAPTSEAKVFEWAATTFAGKCKMDYFD